MIKFLKIIAILLCFTITAIVFKDGIPEYNPSRGYAGYMAALILFIVGVALLIKLIFAKINPVMSYRDYLKKVKATAPSNDLKAIEKKEKLLEQVFNDGLLTKKEFQSKTDVLKSCKDDIRKKRKTQNEFYHKKQKLAKLFEGELIAKDEFDEKINALKKELQIDNNVSVDSRIGDDTEIYYVSDCKQHGPMPISYVRYLLKTKQINPNCFYKLRKERTYSHRVRELSN